MLKNYFRIAWRNLWKNKVFSAINIFGLTVGLTCCLLIVLYIKHEVSYDNFQAKGDRIVRVIMEYSMSGSVNKGNFTSTKVLPSFKRNFPEVESGVRMVQTNRIVKYEDKLLTEKRFLYADSTFLDIFSFKLLKGNPKYALAGPNKVLITESTAKRYFGNDDPVGKILKISSNATDYEVTGVLEDCPSNSQIKYDFLASFSSTGTIQEETYWNANSTTYLLLNSPTSIASLQPKVAPFMKKEMGGELSGNDYVTFELEPFKKVHLYSQYEGFEPNSSITYIYIVSAIALLILAIACFTYINLSTARSMERAKEVGIRKVAGAYKNQIFWQFITESVVVSVIAIVLSVAATVLLLPAFNHLSERQLEAVSLASRSTIAFALIIMLIISFLAGSYPAIILSRFQPIKVLKGVFKNTTSSHLLRKSLIVFQFVISVFLIVSTFIIQNQLHYIQSKKLGYNRDHIIVLPIDQKIIDNINTIKTELKSNVNVLSITRAVHAPTYIQGGYSMRSAEMPVNKVLGVTANPVDEEFVNTTGLQIIAGTDFIPQDVKDVDFNVQEKKAYHFILNESAVKELGWKPEEAIGKKMFLGDQRPGIIKAVIKDFHFASLHEPIKPLVLFPDTWGAIMMVKLSGNSLPSTLSFIEQKWKTLVPYRPFEYTFLDDNYNKLYASELRVGKVLNIFALVAIILACLGLFGLSAYSIQQRTKEIGIRKVVGATVTNIVTLLSKDFLRLVIIAVVIASPIAWYAVNQWLQDFAYRVDINWWIFAVAAVIVLIIALFTISFQAVKAALANPVKSLKTE